MSHSAITSEVESEYVRVMLAASGLRLDEAELGRMTAAFQHYRAGIKSLYDVVLPADTTPYLVADVRPPTS